MSKQLIADLKALLAKAEAEEPKPIMTDRVYYSGGWWRRVGKTIEIWLAQDRGELPKNLSYKNVSIQLTGGGMLLHAEVEGWGSETTCSVSYGTKPPPNPRCFWTGR